jgi:hypothetical protein
VAICKWEPERALLKHPNDVSVFLGCDVSSLDDWYPMFRHSMTVLCLVFKNKTTTLLCNIRHQSSSDEAPYPGTIEATTAPVRKSKYSLYLTYITDWPRMYQCHVQGRPLARSRTAENVFGHRCENSFVTPARADRLKIFTLKPKGRLLMELNLFPFYESKTG